MARWAPILPGHPVADATRLGVDVLPGVARQTLDISGQDVESELEKCADMIGYLLENVLKLGVLIREAQLDSDVIRERRPERIERVPSSRISPIVSACASIAAFRISRSSA